VGVVLIVITGVLIWYNHRPQPADLEESIFQGVTYFRESRTEPRPIVIHTIKIDLNAPGIGFTITPPDPADGRPLRAQTTSHFLTTSGVQIAINADFFTPWWSNTIFDYYPHIGDSVDIHGFASYKGTPYGNAKAGDTTLYLSKDAQASVGAPIGEIDTAVSGNAVLLDDGEIVTQVGDSTPDETNPRTAAGIDTDTNQLILMVIDGRQPNYSEGTTIPELAAIMKEYGAEDAINLDGGGSSTMVIESGNGQPVILNSPIDNRIPGRERAVANQLGVFAQPVSE
jgi:hypothetical protein